MKRWVLVCFAVLSLLGVVAVPAATAGTTEPAATLDLNVVSIKVVDKGAAAVVTYTLDCSVNLDYVSVGGQILQTSGRTITFSNGGAETSCVAGETTTGTVIFSVLNGKLKSGPATVQLNAYSYNYDTNEYVQDSVFANMRLR